jgi:hypothetical protein
MSAPGALIHVLRVGLRITTLIVHLTIDGKVANTPGGGELSFSPNENQISKLVHLRFGRS